MDHINLIGAQDVRASASNMRQAASEMSNAAATIDSALERHQRFMEDWLQRFAQQLEQHVLAMCIKHEVIPAPPTAEVEGDPPGPAPEPHPYCTKIHLCSLRDGHDGACNEDNIPF